MLAKARQRLPNCTFIPADIATWTLPPRTDLIFAN
ncbi:MAG: trans-aconitate 2-methyltransferase, partial [Methylocella sp.]